MGIVIGIDPGVSGAVAVLFRAPQGTAVHCWDMPTVEVRGKRHVCPHGLRSLLAKEASPDYLVDAIVLEHVQGVQGTGATSAFSFGRSFGLVEGVVAGLALPLMLVRPQAWTKALGVSRDKGAHRKAAANLWPRQASLFARVKDDGRADAALLCHWWVRHGQGIGDHVDAGTLAAE
jgi:crossover junction endodeoxyribonuclease RuvC